MCIVKVHAAGGHLSQGLTVDGAVIYWHNTNRCILRKMKASAVMEFLWPFDQINIIEFHKF